MATALGVGSLRGRARPICRVLSEHGCKVATSSYYAARERLPSARALRDAERDERIQRIHADNY
ncbi:hypothetical protein [Actinomadura nitritigenes]|uniref:hypothetical protein n=1 Tax=Actinomadura nitritigenes TaxID=134602 RepID=UPI003D923070